MVLTFVFVVLMTLLMELRLLRKEGCSSPRADGAALVLVVLVAALMAVLVAESAVILVVVMVLVCVLVVSVVMRLIVPVAVLAIAW